MMQNNEKRLTSLQPRHVPQIAAMERMCFSDPWSEETLAEELHTPLSRYFICEEGEQVLGYIGTRLVLDECYITNVAVLPQRRREGIATMLLDALEAFARENNMSMMTLEVRVSNTPARTFYEKSGFVPVGVRPGYYEDPREDAVLMTKLLQTSDEIK